MSSIPFDTHAAVKRLTEAGVTEAQAEALIRAISDAQARADLVTRADIRDMATKTDLAALELRLIKWMAVQTIAIIGITVTLIQLLK